MLILFFIESSIGILKFLNILENQRNILNKKETPYIK